jgi:hypothetical protein
MGRRWERKKRRKNGMGSWRERLESYVNEGKIQAGER